MQAKVEHRFSNGVHRSGFLDLVKGNRRHEGQQWPRTAPGSGFQNPANLRAERGLLDTHLAQRFVLSGIWDLPFGRGRRFGSQLASCSRDDPVGGWSLGGILTLTAGRPFNVTVSGDPANSGQTDRADVVGDP